MTTGTWLVLCRRERLISLDDLAARLQGVKNIRVGSPDQDVLVVTALDRSTGASVDINVWINAEPHVALESAEIAEDFGEGRPDADVIAQADARYELLWDLALSYAAYNALCVISEVLATACGGVVFDATDGRIVWSPLEPEPPEQERPAPAPAPAPARDVADEDVASVLDGLAAADPAERASTLRTLISFPRAHPRIAEALARLLEDRAVCVVSTPLRYGEVRYLAATVLAAVRAALGDATPVRARFARPLTVTEIDHIERAAGLEPLRGIRDPANPHARVLAAYRRLVDRGLVPEIDHTFG
ncbi:MAG TPA: hypothetical protein VKZ63_21365 [Kofleriaceae bacterium]|nr:hypothetical protein [Kofleriaceae bacterium]